MTHPLDQAARAGVALNEKAAMILERIERVQLDPSSIDTQMLQHTVQLLNQTHGFPSQQYTSTESVVFAWKLITAIQEDLAIMKENPSGTTQ